MVGAHDSDRRLAELDADGIVAEVIFPGGSLETVSPFDAGLMTYQYERDPAWWLNLVAHPDAVVTLGRDSWQIHAVLADTEQRARLWPLLKEHNPAYAGYEKKTQREIPVVILKRTPQ